jgi:hypothetical protein
MYAVIEAATSPFVKKKQLSSSPFILATPFGNGIPVPTFFDRTKLLLVFVEQYIELIQGLTLS